jgi:CheY-like chemotaxis protein
VPADRATDAVLGRQRHRARVRSHGERDVDRLRLERAVVAPQRDARESRGTGVVTRVHLMARGLERIGGIARGGRCDVGDEDLHGFLHGVVVSGPASTRASGPRQGRRSRAVGRPDRLRGPSRPCPRPGRLKGVTVRVFLLDDHEIVRQGLRGLIEVEDDMTVIGEAGTAEEALTRIPATRPDVAVLDVRLPDGDGVEVCREVRSRFPDLQCLMLRRRGLRPQADTRHRPGRRHPPRRSRRVAARSRRHRTGPRAAAPRAEGGRGPRAALRAGAAHPGPHRRGLYEPPDLRDDLPRGEDREELRVEPVGQARHGTPDGGRGIRRPARRTAPPHARLRRAH